jgi:uncharacterized membrane protein
MRMQDSWKAQLRELLFRTSVFLKGLDALIEIVGGIALWIIKPSQIARVVALLTQDEIVEDPRDLVANYLRHVAGRVSVSSEHFIAVYLLGHGLVKMFVVVALLKNKLWGYPLSILVFGGFIVYQVYRYTLTGGIGLVALTVFDLIVISLIWLEYRAVKARSSRGTDTHPQ